MSKASFSAFKWFLLYWILPEFQLEEIETIYVTAGSDVKIRCPNDRVDYWQYHASRDILVLCENGQNSINPSLNISDRLDVTSDCQLIFKNFRIMDLGRYSCIAAGISKSYTIQVKLRKLKIDGANNSVIQGTEGENLTLTCILLGFRLGDTLYWTKDQTILASTNTQSLSYTIQAHRIYNMKEFVCMTNNSKDKFQLKVHIRLDLLLKPTVSISVLLNYNVTKKENRITVRQGLHIELQCLEKSNASGDVEILSWFLNGKHLPYKNKTIVFNKIIHESSGQYTCVARNKAGEDFDAVNITVTYPPIVRSKTVTFSEGNRPRTLKCEVSGEPNAYNFTWRHYTNSNQLVRMFYSNNGRALILPAEDDANDLVYEDSGVYLCNVTNGIPDESGNLWQIGRIKLIIAGKPVLAKPQKSKHVGHLNRTSKISLFVLSSSNVSKSYWRDGGKNLIGVYPCSSIVNTALYFGKIFNVSGYECVYQIRNTRTKDFQNYTVDVVNENGRATFYISLILLHKPEMPRNVQVIGLKLKIIVKWSAGKSCGLRQRFIIEYRKRFDPYWNKVLSESNSYEEIDGLSGDTVYFVRLFSRTVVGESNITDEILVITGSHDVVDHPYSWKISVISSAAVVGFLLCLYGLKALSKRSCFHLVQNGNNASQDNVTSPSTREGQYDDIDSVYYNERNVNVRPELISNRSLVTWSNERNIAITTTDNAGIGNYNAHERRIHGIDINTSGDDIMSARSSSHALYQDPCHNYINLEFGVTGENTEQIREEEYLADSSSSSNSEIREIQTISDHQYEALDTMNIEEHVYE